MILSGQTIRRRCLDFPPMLEPFSERMTAFGLTFGLSVAGYDLRCEFDPDGLISGKPLYPGGFLLCSTIERFNMPRNVMAIVHDKSSWARKGLAVQNTVIEPGWNGYLTLELTNHSEIQINLKRGMPIAQVVFHQTDEPVEIGYVGKYQNQGRGPQSAR